MKRRNFLFGLGGFGAYVAGDLRTEFRRIRDGSCLLDRIDIDGGDVQLERGTDLFDQESRDARHRKLPVRSL